MGILHSIYKLSYTFLFSIFYSFYTVIVLSDLPKEHRHFIPKAVWLRLDKLIKLLGLIAQRAENNGMLSPTDIGRIKTIYIETLALHVRYNCLTPECAKEFTLDLKRIIKIK